jgi:GNAT superfamily N-acetyltransferase
VCLAPRSTAPELRLGGRFLALAPSDKVQIRDATWEDWPAIWPIVRQITSDGETFIWPTDVGEDEARAMWFGEPPARVAGASFMVHADHYGRGIGRALGEHVLERARAEGYRAMQFNAVVEANTGAVALWRSLGFEVIGTIPDGFRRPTEGYVGLHIMYRRV